MAFDRPDGAPLLVEPRTGDSTFRAIFEAVNDAIFVHDLETGAIVDVNRRMCQMFGYTYEEALGLDIGDVSDGDRDVNDRALQLLRRAAEEPLVFEWRCRHKSGRAFWAEVSLRRATIDGLDRILAIVRDVSERKQAVAALRESEAKLRSITEASPDFIMLVDLDGRIDFVNRTVDGRTHDEVIGRTVYDFVDAKFHKRMRACYERVRARRQPGRYEVDYAAADASCLTFETRVGPVLRDGVVVAFALSATDITQRRAALAAARESEELFRQLTESINEVFWLVDWPTTDLIYVSPSYETICGTPTEELNECRWRWAEHIHPDDRRRVFEALEEHLPSDYDIEFRIVRPDGQVRWIHEKAFPIRDASGRIYRVSAVSEDITDRKKAVEELQRNSKRETLLLRELDHRVRNNLAALTTLVDVTRSSAADTDRFATAVTGRIHTMAIVHNLLSCCRWAMLDLSQLVTSLVPSDAPGRLLLSGETVLLRPDQASSLAMVLHELITNSMKYGSLGTAGGSIDVSWTIQPKDGDVISVHLQWVERGGPEIEAVPTLGVGTSLIEGLIRSDLRGEAKLSFPRTGAAHRFTMLVHSLVEDRA